MQATIKPMATLAESAGAPLPRATQSLIRRGWLRRNFSLLMAGLPAAAIGQEWPQWRGPNRDGMVPAGPAVGLWPEKLKQGWRVTVGEGHASPVAGGTSVFQFARVGDREVAAAYDSASGKKLWEYGYSAPYEMNPAAVTHGKGPKSTPLLSAKNLYTFGITGVLTCLDAANGKLLWRYDSGSQWKTASPTFGVAMSPIAAGGNVVAHVGTDKDGALTAFEAATGRVRWQWKGEGPGYASPVLLKTGAVTQLITFSAEKLVGLNAANGALEWELPFTTPYSQNAVTPFLIGDVLIYGGLSHPMTAARVSGKSIQKLWENREAEMYMSSPVLAAGLLHGLTSRNKGQFVSVDPKTGKTVWTSDGRQAENAMFLSQGDIVFALTTESVLHVMRASAKGLQPLRKYTVANSPTWAHPIIIGNRILVKDKDSLALWTA